ncbi:MAG TPA: extracellular solute-binding protein, partial [Candidatus Limnocylindrales bacterium]|nr:extracellular solute-binding protein [Candidatus Limnocylindrales bacterium]
MSDQRFPRIPDDPITRRELLRRAGAAGVMVAAGPTLLAACQPGGGGGPVTLTFVSYGGAYQEAQRKGWLEPYAKANPNITFKEEEPTEYAKLQAMVQAKNVTWDVVDVGSDFGLERNKDILEPIDCNVVPCGDFPPQFKGTYRIADIIYGVVMAYRTDKFGGAEPAGWADFFDLQKFPGKRGLWKFASGGV